MHLTRRHGVAILFIAQQNLLPVRADCRKENCGWASMGDPLGGQCNNPGERGCSDLCWGGNNGGSKADSCIYMIGYI